MIRKQFRTAGSRLLYSITFLLVFISGCNQDDDSEHFKNSLSDKAEITFIELGSVNCIPCKKMVPVMEGIKAKYGDKINVIFYDVWKPDQKKYAEQYGIRLIPTQVFIDKDGKEFHRHEGFYPSEEIVKLLSEHGVTGNN